MHDIRLMMARDYPDISNVTIVTSITNKEHMETIFKEHLPEYVFHAAAYKHVPMMEDNPAIAVQNNINGTRVIADLAVKYGTRKFVMISTDKAVNPVSVMGMTKRLAEVLLLGLNAQKDGGADGTVYSCVRFGNVLGSSGSVVPLFREQIAHRGPVTVTHPEMRRYFMSVEEAVGLVLEAAVMGNGCIYTLDMGRPVRIVDLAEDMIRQAGYKPYVDVPIVFTGIRPGEKLFEELDVGEKSACRTGHARIFVCTAAGRGGDVAYEEVAAFAAGMPDGEAVKRFLRERVGA